MIDSRHCIIDPSVKFVEAMISFGGSNDDDDDDEAAGNTGDAVGGIEDSCGSKAGIGVADGTTKETSRT